MGEFNAPDSPELQEDVLSPLPIPAPWSNREKEKF
jgi:hypothetical protein